MFKVLVFLGLMTLAAGTILQSSLIFNPLRSELNEHWEQFKVKYTKQYPSTHHETKRRMIWEANLKKIQKHNIEYDLGKHTYFLGINQFSDMTFKEFSQTLRPFKRNNLNTGANFFKPSNVKDLPTSVDWRLYNYVTPVKDQGNCGSCWSFSTTGALEGQHAKIYKKLVSLSEQNLIDCSGSWGNNGCGGGLMDYAFRYVKDNGGIDTEASYPYKATEGPCHFKKANIGATCTGYVDIPTGNETALTMATAYIGPISVAIDANHPSFMHYRGGIFDEPSCSSTQLDHGVLVVGYGTENGQDFWMVKNSWNTSWGMSGYVKMSRNKKNQCGIATAASFPKMT